MLALRMDSFPDPPPVDRPRPIPTGAVLHSQPSVSGPARADLLFLHGAYSNAQVWWPYFAPYLAARGWAGHALDFRGHGAASAAGMPWSFGLDDLVADARAAIEAIDRPVVLIGHSLGGLIAQMLLPDRRVAGLCLVASVPPDGLWAINLTIAMTDPALWVETLNAAMAKPVRPDGHLRRALFSDSVEEPILEAFAAGIEDAPYRAMVEAHQARVWHSTMFLGPRTLVIGARHDRLIPRDAIWRTAAFHGAACHIVEDSAHAIMLDAGWRAAADRLLGWLR